MAAGAGLAASATLIDTLHRPGRWYNMLRLFKRTSPTSLGIWAITPFTALSALAAGDKVMEDLGFKKTGHTMARLLGIPASLLSMVTISYMGAELEEMNMPVWASAHPLLAPFFAAAGMSCSTACLTLVASATNPSPSLQKSLNRYAAVTTTVQLALATVIETRWGARPETAKFSSSHDSRLLRAGFLSFGQGIPLFLRLFEQGEGDGLPLLSSLATLAGQFLTQLSLLYAGKESARHPRDYFAFARPAEQARLESGSLEIRQKADKSLTAPQTVHEGSANDTVSILGMVGMGLLVLGALESLRSYRVERKVGQNEFATF
jgi:formate-dependent nitrite reductase membrane component NrfD